MSQTDKTRGVSIGDIIQHHTKAAEACEAYAKSMMDESRPGFKHPRTEARLTEHYAKRAEWHRQAVERIRWIIRLASS